MVAIVTSLPPFTKLASISKPSQIPPSFPSLKLRKLNFKRKWRSYASVEEVLPIEEAARTVQQVDIPADDGGQIVITVLSLVAFAALSILTIGIIYIAVTDFFEKREKEKFEKEEELIKKQSKKKKKAMNTRATVKGFGKKAEVAEIDEELL